MSLTCIVPKLLNICIVEASTVHLFGTSTMSMPWFSIRKFRLMITCSIYQLILLCVHDCNNVYCYAVYTTPYNISKSGNAIHI